MKLFENGVGRPSNEVKKKRMLFIISTMIIAVGLIAVSLGFLLTKTNNVSVSKFTYVIIANITKNSRIICSIIE